MNPQTIIMIALLAVMVVVLIGVSVFMRRRNPGRTVSPFVNAIMWVVIYTIFSIMPISSDIVEIILRAVILVSLLAELFFSRKLSSAGITMPRGNLFGFLFYLPMVAIVGVMFIGEINPYIKHTYTIITLVENVLLAIAGEIIFTGLLFKVLSERNILIAYASRIAILPVLGVVGALVMRMSVGIPIASASLAMSCIMNAALGFMSAAYFRKSQSILPLIVLTVALSALSVMWLVPPYVYIIVSVIAAGYGAWILWRA